MTRAIVAAALYRPSWEFEGRPAEGPDEDALTLAVAATELLPHRSGPVDRLDWVGPSLPGSDWALAEALDLGHLTLRRHVGEPGSLFQALDAAANAPGPGASILVVPEGSAPTGGTLTYGAAAAAFLLEEGHGLRPRAHGGRRHPRGDLPDASAWTDALEKGSGIAEGGPVRLLVRARTPPPALLVAIGKRWPHAAVETGPDAIGPLAPGPMIAEARSLHDLAAPAAAPASVALARIAPDATVFAGFESTAPVKWTGRWDETAPLPRRGALAPAEEPDLRRALSEGAYVPRPRYLENLGARWRLAADRCGACGNLTFPPRASCRACGRSDALTRERLPEAGLVEAVTTVAPGAQPTEFDALVASVGAYDVALVAFAPGARLTLQVADLPAGRLRIGDTVRTGLRRLYPMDGEWRYGRKALPGGPAPTP